MNTPTLLVLLLSLAVVVPGCLSSEDEPAPAGNTTATKNGLPLDANGTPVDAGDPMSETATGNRSTDPGSVAHKHDYWAGQTEVVLVEGEYQPSLFCMTSKSGQFQAGCFTVEMGNGSIVYQGTKTLTVVATWNDPKVTGLAMTYRDASAVHPEPLQLTSGTPFEIEVNPGTADLPHSKESNWVFQFRGSGSAPAGAAWAPVHIKIFITRGLDLPLDPAHPDFWADRTEIDLGTSVGVQKRPEAEFVLLGSNVAEPITLPPGSIVPPGTTLLTAHFTWEVKDPQSGVSYRVFPYYRSAQAPYWRYASGAEVDQSQGEGMFMIEVEPEMTDSPYATLSQWDFMLRQAQVESTTGLPVPISWFGANPLDRDIEYSFHVTVSNLPVEGDEDEQDDEGDRVSG